MKILGETGGKLRETWRNLGKTRETWGNLGKTRGNSGKLGETWGNSGKLGTNRKFQIFSGFLRVPQGFTGFLGVPHGFSGRELFRGSEGGGYYIKSVPPIGMTDNPLVVVLIILPQLSHTTTDHISPY